MPTLIPPPAISTPFVDSRGYLTVSALQFLQPVFAAVQGLGGGFSPDALFASGTVRRKGISASANLWTPTVAGSTTAGAQTYGTQLGWHADIGAMRIAWFQIVMTAKDGATAGNATIGGLTAPGNPGSPLIAGWLSEWSATLSGGYSQLGVDLTAGAAALNIVQSGTGVAALALPAGGLGATSAFTGGVIYFR